MVDSLTIANTMSKNIIRKRSKVKKHLTKIVTLVLVASLMVIVAIPVFADTKVYTTDTDFGTGVPNNVIIVATGDPAYLQLDDTVTPFDFIWVAVSSRGTVVKIDTNTGEVLGEYMTSPGQNGNPSRTTVDNNGNAWVANRNNVGPNGYGTVIHLASIPTDVNNDTVITTSTGLGDILAWGTDEAVLHYVEVNSKGTRHISVDGNNDVWVGGLTNPRAFTHIDGNTGLIIPGDSYTGVGYGGYGGLIDGNGVIWSARPLLRWDTANPLTGPIGGNWDGYGHDSYGLGIDSQGNVWNTSLSGNLVHKFNSAGVLQGSYAHGEDNAQGVVAGLNDHIWVAHALYVNTDTVGHILNDGTYIGNVDLEPGIENANVGPTGVAVDANGKIWTTGYNNGKVYRIDPNGGVNGADGTTKIGAVDLSISLNNNDNAQLYNYSDMTGSTLIAPPNNGTWTVVNDSGTPDATWYMISWNADEPGDSSIIVEVTSSDDGVTFGPLQEVTNGQDMRDLPVPDGQYLKVVVTFTRSTSDEDQNGFKDSPKLFDLTKSTIIPVAVDIHPTSCPNPLNMDGKGVIPVAILGTEDFDVTQIDPASVALEGVSPLRWAMEDVATPYEPFVGKEGCMDCTDEGPDGQTDLTLKFKMQEIVDALGEVNDGDCVVLTLTGNLKEEFGGISIIGEDVVKIIKK
jgi:hypothetical protein